MNDGLKKLRKITKNRVESTRLLESALNKKEFLEYILIYFKEDELLQEIDFSHFNQPLSENEYQQLHHKYNYPHLWDSLSKENFTTVDASNPLKWLSITYQAIKNDIIEPYFLAYNKHDKNGKNNIIEALRLSKKNDDKNLFEIARAILRHMFGSIQERGRKGIFQDNPLAIAWWKIYLSKEISKNTKIKEDDIINYLLINKGAYNDLIEKMGFTLTVMADKNIRDGLFLFALSTDKTGSTKFKQLSNIIGVESAWRGMGNLTPFENQKIIESLI